MQVSSYWLKYGLFACMLVFVNIAVADDQSVDQTIVPPPDQVSVPGCVNSGYTFQQGNVILQQASKGSAQRLYLFKNNAKQIIWLDHPLKNPSASAGWASQLDPLHWSALAMAKPGSFAFSCAVQVNNQITSIPCQSVLQVCQMATATFDNQNSGSYWLVENQYVVQLLSLLISKNIRW